MSVAFQYRIIFLEKFLEMVLNTIKLQGNRKVKKKLILSHRRKFCNFSWNEEEEEEEAYT